jgi:nitroreductase
MDVFEAIHSRHSTRDYLPGAPSDATIQNLMDAAIRAPCAVKRQPWRFTVVANRRCWLRFRTELRPI